MEVGGTVTRKESNIGLALGGRMRLLAAQS